MRPGPLTEQRRIALLAAISLVLACRSSAAPPDAASPEAGTDASDAHVDASGENDHGGVDAIDSAAVDAVDATESSDAASAGDASDATASDASDASTTSDASDASDTTDASITCAAPSPTATWTNANLNVLPTLLTNNPVTSMWAVAAGDVWLTTMPRFGSRPSAPPPSGQLAHWDGAAWTIARSVSGNPFNSVWASGPNDVWLATSNELQRWDGTAWSTVTPFPVTGANYMYLVWGGGPGDVWALRGAGAPGVFHWDGIAWEEREIGPQPAPADSPPQIGTAAIVSLYGATPNDVWAAGTVTYPMMVGLSNWVPMLAHWDGVQWSVTIPETSSSVIPGGLLVGNAASNVWALNGLAVFHYDGHAWTRMSDLPGSGKVTAAWIGCGNSLWAATFDSTGNTPSLLQFNGVDWSPVNPQASNNYVSAATGTGPDEVWFGGYDPGGGILLHRHL